MIILKKKINLLNKYVFIFFINNNYFNLYIFNKTYHSINIFNLFNKMFYNFFIKKYFFQPKHVSLNNI